MSPALSLTVRLIISEMLFIHSSKQALRLCINLCMSVHVRMLCWWWWLFQVIIMAFDCAECGYKSNEVKGGGSVPAQGTVHTLTAQSAEDFSRDILKVSTCSISPSPRSDQT